MRISIAVTIVALLGGTLPADEPERYAGRPLSDALHLLQQRGLRIVYSSAVVTPDMRVLSEPRSADARLALVEILRPHGLAPRPGPGGVLQIVRAARERPKPDAGRSKMGPIATPGPPAETPPVYDEEILVLASADDRRDSGVVAQSNVGAEALRLRAGVMAADPLRAVHTMPRVAASDDFRGEFSVRGSPYRHLGVVIDGVATSALQHAAYGVGDSASLTMLNPDVIDQATLQVGAYPQRFGDRLGGQLAMTLREGSRQRTSVSGSFGGVAAALVGEGPLGSSGQGSWLVSGRQSYLDFPTTKFGAEYGGMGFAFRDMQAKAVYDASKTQQVSVTVVAGQTNAEHGNDTAPRGVSEAIRRAGLLTAGWRSTLGSATVLTQRVHVLASNVWNTGLTGALVGEGRQREVAYRGEVAHAWPQMFLEAGAAVQRMKGVRAPGFTVRGWERSGYVHAAWTPTPRLTVSPGIRIAGSTLASRAAASPWILSEWTWAPGWTLMASTGVGHQFAAVEDVLVTIPHRRFAPARARYLDAGLERSIGHGVRLQATVFDRRERDVLDWQHNTLTGRSRGAELLIEREPSTGLAGSLAYSFGRTQYADTVTGERFWADFDQRHQINAFASYSFARTTLAAAFRSGTNFPIAGYFSTHDETLVAGDRRNTVRQRPYARLDLQATRAFMIGGRGLTVYLELLNVLNRANDGPADGVILSNGEAVGFTEKLLPRFLTGGIRIDF